MNKLISKPFARLHSVSFTKKLLLFFWICFFLGILLFNVIGRNYLNDFTFFSDMYLEHFKNSSFRFSELFPYILKQRFFTLFLLLILGSTRLRNPFYSLFCGWYGLSYGMLSSFCCFKFSFIGSLLFLAMLFPQFPFFLASFVLLIHTFHRDQKQYPTHSKISPNLFPCTVSVLLVFIGCLLESYISPILVQKIFTFV